MSTKINLNNGVDTYVRQGRPSEYGGTRLYVQQNVAFSYLFFQPPILPAGSQIIAARLILTAREPLASKGSGYPTINLYRLTENFDSTGTNWNDLPTTGLLAAELSGPTDGKASWSFDIMDHIQDIVDGERFYGWRIGSLSGTEYSFDSSYGNGRPVLFVEYTTPPRKPQNFQPTENQVIRDEKPTLRWNYAATSDSLDQFAYQVQVATNEALSANLFDSGQVNSPSSTCNLALTSYPAIPTGQTRYWRVRVKNDSGLWSEWSNVMAFKYERVGTVQITSPGATSQDPTPDVSWTYANGTNPQQAFQIIITDTGGVTKHDSGIIASTNTTYTLPLGIAASRNSFYKAFVRVWEDSQKAGLPGAPAWAEGIVQWQYTPSNSAAPVSDIKIEGGDPWPMKNVTWQYLDGTADYFAIFRKRTGDEQWELKTIIRPQESAIPGRPNWFQWNDWNVPGRTTVTYFISVVKNRVASENNQEASVKVKNRFPWLIPYDSTQFGRSVPIVNADIDPGLTEISDIVTPNAGRPFIVYQKFNGFLGTCEGEISSTATDGARSSEKMKDDFLWMRKNPHCFFVWADNAIECYIHSVEYDSNPQPDGTTDYFISFGFVQVDNYNGLM